MQRRRFRRDTKSKWIIRIELNVEEMLDRAITMDDINFAIKSMEKILHAFTCDYNSEQLVFRLRVDNLILGKKKEKSLDQSDEIYLLKNLQDKLLDNLVLRGVKNISKVIPRKIMDSLIQEGDSFVKKETWVLDTVGTNLLELLSLDFIDSNRTYTNDFKKSIVFLELRQLDRRFLMKFRMFSQTIVLILMIIIYHCCVIA